MRELIDSKWIYKLFTGAGVLMTMNTLVLWIRNFSDFQISILWAAIPAITAFTFSLLGLLKLYAKASESSPKMAKVGLVCAALSFASLITAAIWIAVLVIWHGEMPQPTPSGLMGLIALFMLAMISAFTCNACVFIRNRTLKTIGGLFAIPVAMWAIMLVVAIFKGIAVGLSIDHYTNAGIAIAFLALGYAFGKKWNES